MDQPIPPDASSWTLRSQSSTRCSIRSHVCLQVVGVAQTYLESTVLVAYVPSRCHCDGGTTTYRSSGSWGIRIDQSRSTCGVHQEPPTSSITTSPTTTPFRCSAMPAARGVSSEHRSVDADVPELVDGSPEYQYGPPRWRRGSSGSRRLGRWRPPTLRRTVAGVERRPRTGNRRPSRSGVHLPRRGAP